MNISNCASPFAIFMALFLAALCCKWQLQNTDQ